jgi:hypothetical protein
VGIERIFKQHRQIILDSINRNRLEPHELP